MEMEMRMGNGNGNGNGMEWNVIRRRVACSGAPPWKIELRVMMALM
jgi:hypothetical protein